MVGLRAAFSGTGMGAGSAEGKEATGDGSEKGIAKRRRRGKAGERREPGEQERQGGFEAEAGGRESRRSGSSDERADEVIGNPEEGEFAENDRRRFSSQDIHSQGTLDISKKEFSDPTLTVEICDVSGGVAAGINQGSDQPEMFGAEAVAVKGDFDDAEIEAGWQAEEEMGRERRGTAERFEPADNMVVRSKTSDDRGTGDTALMKTEDHINATEQEQGDGGITAEGTVSQDNIVRSKEGPESAEEAGFMNAEGTGGQGMDGAGGKREEHNDAHDGEATTGLLRRRLGIAGLIGGGIGQRDGGAVGNKNPSGVPEPGGRSGLLEAGGEVTSEVEEQRQGEPATGLTIGGGAGGRSTALGGLEEETGPGTCGAAGGGGGKDLSKECAEGNQGREEADAAGRTQPLGEDGGDGEELVAHGQQVGERAAAELLEMDGKPGRAGHRTPPGEKRVDGIATSIYTCSIPVKRGRKGEAMNAGEGGKVQRLRRRYAALRERLGGLGLICQGTITERVIETRKGGKRKKKRYGPYYQWTRKKGAKTVTVNLAPEQAHVYQRAIREDRQLHRILDKMRQASLQILSATTVGVPRRNRMVARTPESG